MIQLAPLDSVFLSLETPETPSQIGGLALLDPDTAPASGLDFDRFREFVAERVQLCPRFQWRVQQVPLGLDASGLPLGVQVVSRPGNDHVTIAVAMELERAFGGWTLPATFTHHKETP